MIVLYLRLVIDSAPDDCTLSEVGYTVWTPDDCTLSEVGYR